MISGQQTGRHQRTTWLYKPTFYKLKDDFEERPEVFKKAERVEINMKKILSFREEKKENDLHKQKYRCSGFMSIWDTSC